MESTEHTEDLEGVGPPQMSAQRDHMGPGAMARCPPCWMLGVDGIHQSSDPKETKAGRKRMRKENYVGTGIRVSVTLGM